VSLDISNNSLGQVTAFLSDLKHIKRLTIADDSWAPLLGTATTILIPLTADQERLSAESSGYSGWNAGQYSKLEPSRVCKDTVVSVVSDPNCDFADLNLPGFKFYGMQSLKERCEWAKKFEKGWEASAAAEKEKVKMATFKTAEAYAINLCWQ
jgi:hypothetical protein